MLSQRCTSPARKDARSATRDRVPSTRGGCDAWSCSGSFCSRWGAVGPEKQVYTQPPSRPAPCGKAWAGRAPPTGQLGRAERALRLLSRAHCPREGAVGQGWGDDLRVGVRTSGTAAPPNSSGPQPQFSPCDPHWLSLSRAAMPIRGGKLQPNTRAGHTYGSSGSREHTGWCQACRVPGPLPAGAH